MERSLDRYRAAATECVAAAAKSSDLDAAATLLLTARKWLDLAQELSKPPDALAKGTTTSEQQP
jgi:hypothetical protein